MITRRLQIQIFSAFLDYMYTLDESLVKSRPIDLLICADKYNVGSLLSDCDRFFISSMSKDNIFDYLDISDTFHRHQVQDSAVDFIRSNVFSMVHDLEGWSRLHNRFETLTNLIASYSRFIDFKEYKLSPDFWAQRKGNDGFILKENLSVLAGSKNYSFKIEVDHDARGECLLGIMHLGEEYSSSVQVYVWLEIESDNQTLLRDKLLMRWSKMCSVQTSMDVECWRFVNVYPQPIMSTGPIMFTLPNVSIFDHTLNFKVAVSSLPPQSVSGVCSEFLTPVEITLSELRNLFSSSNNDGLRNDFGLKSKFDFQWSGFSPALTVGNAPSTLCRIVEKDGSCKNENQEKLKHQVLQFIKFHAAEVTKCDDWDILESRPDLMRDLLLEMAQ
uniref:Uncharacterized protein n=2 Tax=Lygus hesperus TaxID=30085 RepID=A0A0K8TBY3_LYGHE